MRYVFVLFMLMACTHQTKDISKSSADEIIRADIAMSNQAVRQGFHKALLAYADDSVIKPDNGTLPVIGKAALERSWNGKQDITAISWKPFKAEASSSGDFGYTIGNWKYVTKDTTMYGNYYTIWKRQLDGKWKFVFDGGNDTPAPKQ